MADVVLRSLVRSDAPHVHAVALEAWQFTYRGIFSQEFIQEFVDKYYSADSILSLFEQIESAVMFFDAAIDEQKIVGFCNSIYDGGAQLFRIYLLPSYIGRGIGSSLLNLGEQFLARHGISEYYCFVHARNEIGKKFYAKHGFRHVTEKDHDDEWYLAREMSE